MDVFSVLLSEPDTTRFGFVCARASHVGAADLPALLAFCEAHGVRLVMARCDAASLDAAHRLEDAGFRLMDTLVHSVADTSRSRLDERRNVHEIRPFRTADAPQVLEVARVLFAEYRSHYHADPALDRTRIADGYVDWVRRAISAGPGNEIFVVADGDRIGGYVTLRLIDAVDGEMVIGGVHPDYARRGLYRDFLLTGMAWCHEQGRTGMRVSTQVTNVAVQRAWSELGFRQLRAEYTFHRWFDR